jgi:hypothetical protein
MTLEAIFTDVLLLFVGGVVGSLAGLLRGRAAPPAADDCLTPENQAAALEVLLAAVRTPALAHLRPKIERVLTESGYEPSCASGKCGRVWRPRKLPQFVPERYRHL